MDKQEKFDEKKNQGESQLKAIREAVKNSDSKAALAEQNETIESMKAKTRNKIQVLKQKKQGRYSEAKKEANKRWDMNHKDQKRYITYRSRAKRFIQMATENDLHELDAEIHEKLN